MVEVYDLDGPWEDLVGHVPDPHGAVSQDSAAGRTVEAAPPCFALDTPGELREVLVGVAAGGAFDRRRVRHRTRIAHWNTLFVAPFGSPDRHQLDLARLGGSVGLFPLSSPQLCRPHRDPGAIHAQ